jgi:hypothetical protein
MAQKNNPLRKEIFISILTAFLLGVLITILAVLIYYDIFVSE